MSYKNFSNEPLRENLLEKLSKEVFVNTNEGLQRFCEKIKYVRGNQMPFMAKQLSKEIMKRSRLCNNFLRNRTEENKILYKRQKELLCILFRENLKEGTMTT